MVCCLINIIICSVSHFLGIRIQLCMEECRRHFALFSLSFLSRRVTILPGLLQSPSNTWRIFSAGWRIGWVVTFTWSEGFMNKTASYRSLKNFLLPILFLWDLLWGRLKTVPGQYLCLTKCLVATEIFSICYLPRYSQFSQNSTSRNACMCAVTV